MGHPDCDPFAYHLTSLEAKSLIILLSEEGCFLIDIATAMLAVKQAHIFNKIRLGFPSKLINSQRSRFIMASTQNEVQLNNALITIDTDAYDEQLHAKQAMLEAKFAEFQPPKLEVFRSQPKHYRMRYAVATISSPSFV